MNKEQPPIYDFYSLKEKIKIEWLLDLEKEELLFIIDNKEKFEEYICELSLDILNFKNKEVDIQASSTLNKLSDII